MQLGKEVGLGPGHIVLDGDPAPHSSSSPLFDPCLLRPNGRPSQQLLSSCYLLTSRSLSETFIRKKLLISSSGSCDDSNPTWQEIGCTCGSACSCPRPGSRIVVPLFEYALPLSIRYLFIVTDFTSCVFVYK